MPDVCDLILDDHERLRRRFAELDEVRSQGRDVLSRVWEPIAELLDLHAATEEAVFYPELLEEGEDAEDETTDAISDHNKIRDAVKAAGQAEPGSDEWWNAVQEAREQNSDHMGEEERGALADFRANTSPEQRGELGARFERYKDEQAGGRGVDTEDKDPDDYIAEHS